jgi:hypothetical protein
VVKKFCGLIKSQYQCQTQVGFDFAQVKMTPFVSVLRYHSMLKAISINYNMPKLEPTDSITLKTTEY